MRFALLIMGILLTGLRGIRGYDNSFVQKLFGLAPQSSYGYYNAHSYGHPSQPQYYGDYQRQQQQQVAPKSRHQKSYKEICRTVHADGFTNPMGVPKCPY